MGKCYDDWCKTHNLFIVFFFLLNGILPLLHCYLYTKVRELTRFSSVHALTFKKSASTRHASSVIHAIPSVSGSNRGSDQLEEKRLLTNRWKRWFWPTRRREMVLTNPKNRGFWPTTRIEGSDHMWKKGFWPTRRREGSDQPGEERVLTNLWPWTTLAPILQLSTLPVKSCEESCSSDCVRAGRQCGAYRPMLAGLWFGLHLLW